MVMFKLRTERMSVGRDVRFTTNGSSVIPHAVHVVLRRSLERCSVERIGDGKIDNRSVVQGLREPVVFDHVPAPIPVLVGVPSFSVPSRRVSRPCTATRSVTDSCSVASYPRR